MLYPNTLEQKLGFDKLRERLKEACISPLGFDTATENDLTYVIEDIKIFIDKRHLMYVIGVSVDYEEGTNGSGYTVSALDKM